MFENAVLTEKIIEQLATILVRMESIVNFWLELGVHMAVPEQSDD
jgi:hypothetical protein